jgi:hypothetical protein
MGSILVTLLKDVADLEETVMEILAARWVDQEVSLQATV